ncbi:MAG: helix-turn-helix domain-containing protein [Candidatus Omnitrophota bacterium]|nr:MAG: helix-turn-helix domain-containing protein [Candidatus Omnitrophota bacterium]
MQSVGEKLKKARQEKRISLDEVYKDTKIHHNILQALEEDRADSLLSPIYIKGFLKTYARYLGLDSEQLLREYTNEARKDEPKEAPKNISKDDQKKEVNQFTHPVASVVAASPVTAVSDKKPQSRKIPQLKPVSIIRGVLIIVFSFAFVFYFRFVLKNISRSTEGKQQIAKEIEKPKVKPKIEVKAVPVVLPQAEDLILEVKTLDNCWMRVKTDEQAVFEKTLYKGKTERWRAKDRIELRIGKPEVIEVSLNGNPVDLKKAQVKRALVVTREGIEGK